MEFRWLWACESPQSRDEEPFRGIVSLAPVISVQNVSKCYHLYPRAVDRLWSSLSIGRASAKSEFWAVRNVSFRVEKGEVLALLGPNGSGKSTLLQIISGILQPTSGRVLSAGRIAAHGRELNRALSIWQPEFAQAAGRLPDRRLCAPSANAANSPAWGRRSDGPLVAGRGHVRLAAAYFP